MQESWGYPCAQQTSVSSDGTVLWSCPFLPLPLTTSGKRSMYYAMRMTEDKTVDTERDSAHFVTDETEGCFSVLQCVAACCDVLLCVAHGFASNLLLVSRSLTLLQPVAACCSMLQRASEEKLLEHIFWSNSIQFNRTLCSLLAACCSLLQLVAACCSLLQSVAECCRVLQSVAV